ncbi:D-amino-acid oxidase [Chionoecetes opilio]|uniref:D-amino-acid oxidase n=1 Tax=Chionoecetes opilio TaxID=41210 RepID=A0A8J4YL38_CHIOP|nr:D-amino-acid oxidase [Chionoecetes opilio]
MVRVVVVGAGVNGVGSALALQRLHPECQITIIAKDFTPNTTDSESVAVTDLEYDAQSDTERNDAGRVYYEENEPQIVMGSYMFEPEYEVDEQVLAEPEVQQEDLALLQNMDCISPGADAESELGPYPLGACGKAKRPPTAMLSRDCCLSGTLKALKTKACQTLT